MHNHIHVYAINICLKLLYMLGLSEIFLVKIQIERETAYTSTTKEVSKWQPIVRKNAQVRKS